MSVGKRIFLQRHMPDPEIMKEFKTIPASNVGDVMNRNSAMNPRIHLVSSPSNQMMVGPALTVKLRAGDNLALHAALNICREGDVLVVSNEGEQGRALIGEVMMAYLMCTKKVAGIVLDGPIRDIDEIGKCGTFLSTPLGLRPAVRTKRDPVKLTCLSAVGKSWWTPETSSWPIQTVW